MISKAQHIHEVIRGEKYLLETHNFDVITQGILACMQLGNIIRNSKNETHMYQKEKETIIMLVFQKGERTEASNHQPIKTTHTPISVANYDTFLWCSAEPGTNIRSLLGSLSVFKVKMDDIKNAGGG